ncbi:MAG TPA: type I restriction endonuclease, partial [Gammaproteobacteria bacterium]|nr:type I restriction endonuclease [Gammaproteobacteria bacterium]
MSDGGMTESIIEQAALTWLERLGWTVKHGPEIAPGELAAERSDFGQVILTQRLQDALAQLNPMLPAEALDDAFRQMFRGDGGLAKNNAQGIDLGIAGDLHGELLSPKPSKIVRID